MTPSNHAAPTTTVPSISPYDGTQQSYQDEEEPLSEWGDWTGVLSRRTVPQPSTYLYAEATIVGFYFWNNSRFWAAVFPHQTLHACSKVCKFGVKRHCVDFLSEFVQRGLGTCRARPPFDGLAYRHRHNLIQTTTHPPGKRTSLRASGHDRISATVLFAAMAATAGLTYPARLLKPNTVVVFVSTGHASCLGLYR